MFILRRASLTLTQKVVTFRSRLEKTPVQGFEDYASWPNDTACAPTAGVSTDAVAASLRSADYHFRRKDDFPVAMTRSKLRHIATAPVV